MSQAPEELENCGHTGRPRASNPVSSLLSQTVRRPLLTTATVLCFVAASAAGWAQTVHRTGIGRLALGVVEHLGQVTEPLGGHELFDYVALEIRAMTTGFERELPVVRRTVEPAPGTGTDARS